MKFKEIKSQVSKDKLASDFQVIWTSKYNKSPRYMDFALYEVLRDMGFNGIHKQTLNALLHWIEA